MRVVPRPHAALALVLCAGSAGAQDFDQAFARPQAVPRIVSEFRFGAIGRDSWGPERGSVSLSGELLLAKPFTAADLFTSYFIPRPVVGGVLNLRGDTNYAFAGLAWTVDVAPRVFLEASFGGAVQDGPGAKIVPLGRTALGTCAPQFREAGAVGVRLSANWSMMATIERLTDYGMCGDGRGLTNIGARLGYTF